MEQMTKLKAIREFLSSPEKPVTLQEIKALTIEEREELGKLCAAALGAELVAG